MEQLKKIILVVCGVVLLSLIVLWHSYWVLQSDARLPVEQQSEVLSHESGSLLPSVRQDLSDDPLTLEAGKAITSQIDEHSRPAQETPEPEDFKAARSARWRFQNKLQEHALSFSGNCDEQKRASLITELLEISRSRLEAEREFPLSAHVIKWEMAFGLPEPGALIWAQWNGNSPATYAIYVQDATELRRSNEMKPSSQSFKVAPAEIEVSLTWQQAVQKLQSLEEKFQQQLGDANYRRLVVTEFAPSEPKVNQLKSTAEKRANFMGEFLNDRILAMGTPFFDCQSKALHALVCACRER